jgi:hypothetical protein
MIGLPVPFASGSLIAASPVFVTDEYCPWLGSGDGLSLTG